MRPATAIPSRAVVPPTVTLTVNGIPDDMKGLLVLPPTGFVVNVAWQPGTYPINPTLLQLRPRRPLGLAGSASRSSSIFR